MPPASAFYPGRGFPRVHVPALITLGQVSVKAEGHPKLTYSRRLVRFLHLLPCASLADVAIAVDHALWRGQVSQTAQLAPMNHGYQLTNGDTPATTVYNASITEFNSYRGSHISRRRPRSPTLMVKITTTRGMLHTDSSGGAIPAIAMQATSPGSARAKRHGGSPRPA
jgi:hypothetical protein